MDADLVIYQISRSRVESMDCSHLLQQFDLHSMAAEEATSLFGRVMFCVEGYDAHPDELHVIPDVRRFLRQWHELCPYWLFFGSLDNDNLRVFYLGLLESLACVQVGSAGLSQTRYDTGELASLLAADMTHADAVCIQLGISSGKRLKRANEILKYFQVILGRSQ